jgi:hypothetical protein
VDGGDFVSLLHPQENPKLASLLTLLVYGRHKCLVEDPYVNIEIAHFVDVSKGGFLCMYEGL